MTDVNLLFNSSSEIFHHGIEGQKWGVRNGPPYPLDRNNAERIVKTEKDKLKTMKEQKKKIGRAAGMAGAAALGGITAYKTRDAIKPVRADLRSTVRYRSSEDPLLKGRYAGMLSDRYNGKRFSNISNEAVFKRIDERNRRLSKEYNLGTIKSFKSYFLNTDKHGPILYDRVDLRENVENAIKRGFLVGSSAAIGYGIGKGTEKAIRSAKDPEYKRFKSEINTQKTNIKLAKRYADLATKRKLSNHDLKELESLKKKLNLN